MEEEKNSSPWEWHSSDDQETINKCLNCPQLYCNNCIDSKAKLKKIGTGFYVPEEIEIIKDISLSNKECSDLLHRSLDSVRNKRAELGIKGYKREEIQRESKYKWNKEIDDHVMSHTPKETAEKYGIPAMACAGRKCFLKKRSGDGRVNQSTKMLS